MIYISIIMTRIEFCIHKKYQTCAFPWRWIKKWLRSPLVVLGDATQSLMESGDTFWLVEILRRRFTQNKYRGIGSRCFCHLAVSTTTKFSFGGIIIKKNRQDRSTKLFFYCQWPSLFLILERLQDCDSLPNKTKCSFENILIYY